jgi:hypothetical protein
MSPTLLRVMDARRLDRRAYGGSLMDEGDYNRMAAACARYSLPGRGF